MSHSAFRILASDEPINHNLVIVVNKNGQVSTDTEALQCLLTSKGSPKTGISIVRETSPTPSISDEIEQDRLENYDRRRQEYLSAHHTDGEFDEDKIDSQLRQMGGLTNDIDIPHRSLTVETFVPPCQARKFVNDVLHLGGIDNPQTLMPIDFNFRRKIIQNDHCYTPLTQPLERVEKKQNIKVTKSIPSKQASKQPHKVPVPVTREGSSDSGEALVDDEECEEEQSENEDVTFSESDDDNDMDFSVNDRFGKKGKKKRKYRKHKPKSISFKDFLEIGDVPQIDDEPKKKYSKTSPKKGTMLKPSTSGKIVVPSKSAQSTVIKKEVQTIGSAVAFKKEAQSSGSSVVFKKEAQSSSSSVVFKKEAQTSGSAVVFNFKKEVQSSGSAVFNVKKEVHSSGSAVAFKNIQIRKDTSQFIPLTASMKLENVLLPKQISIHPSQPMKSKQEIEFVASIVKDLESSFPEPVKNIDTHSIPNIMQMMETNTSAEVIDQSLSTLEQLEPGDGPVGMEEIGDALIAVLGNEAIDELLNQNNLIGFESSPSVPLLKMSQSMNVSTLQQYQENDITPDNSPVSLSCQTPKILNKQVPIKDPIKVVRNGRVITLPPIEAPTTRGAKRRAQGDSPTTPSPSVGKFFKAESTPSNKDPDSKNSSRRSSLNKSESGKSISRRQSFVQNVGIDDELDDLNSDGSWASEDDPDRLWCLCLQPHNNRFMICCDKCEDWFHGKCVNVTKAMGKEYELQGKEWRCPKCKNVAESEQSDAKPGPSKKPLNQQKLTKFFANSQKESTDEDMAKTVCVVCKKNLARESSIYCSDDCIRNHATKHIEEPASRTGPPNAKRGNVLKDKSGNVIVMDKITGKVLPLSKSPHFTKLGQWLSQNTNFEPVKPGSPQAEQILSRTKHLAQSRSKTQEANDSLPTPVKSEPSTNKSSAEDLFSNPVKINTGTSSTDTPKKSSNQQYNLSVKNSELKSSAASSKSTSSSEAQRRSAVKPDVKRFKHHSPEEKSTSNSSNSRSGTDRDRVNVRNTLEETLRKRMQEFEHSDIPKMTDEEMIAFAKATEREMFLLFNKDVREKYKTKYRSLKFNLGDVKNKTLLEKICGKKLTPKQLVQLPSCQLASEELSKWRDNETKHQLEIITKAEIDALAQNKIVVKTHKGEEIIETKCSTSDILVPTIDDVESVVANTVLSLEEGHGRYGLGKLSSSMNLSSENVASVSTSYSSPAERDSDSRRRTRSRSKSRGNDGGSHHHHKMSKKDESHQKKLARRHGSRDKDRKPRDRSNSRKEENHKHQRGRNRSREKEKSGGHSNKSKEQSQKDQNKTENQADTKKFVVQPTEQDADLVSTILSSMGVHLDKPIEPSRKEEKPKIERPKTRIDLATTHSVTEQKQQIEIYSGNLHMGGVASFNVSGSRVSGNFDDILKCFTPQLEVVGRIEPKTVIEYLERATKFPGKELSILRFTSADEVAYETFFEYLCSMQKYGVVKLPSQRIKDFYLFTIRAQEKLPNVLLPIIGPGFVEGDLSKPNLLLGVILKSVEIKAKKVSRSLSSKQSRPLSTMESSTESKGHTSKLTMGLPEFSKSGDLVTKDPFNPAPDKSNDDGDEPYTPFDDDDVHCKTSSYREPSKTANDDLESEMASLNHEIEQRQMEIQTLAKQKAIELDVAQATRIYENITVPHNLSEILSTITKTRVGESISLDDDADEEYVPGPIERSMHAPAHYSAMSNSLPIVNSMMDIDERIPLFQRPSTNSTLVRENVQPSLLANMTDADLMKLVPDGAFPAPPPPNISNHSDVPGAETNDFE